MSSFYIVNRKRDLIPNAPVGTLIHHRKINHRTLFRGVFYPQRFVARFDPFFPAYFLDALLECLYIMCSWKREGKRLTAWYGSRAYRYNNVSHSTNAIPETVAKFLLKFFNEFLSLDCNSILANLYLDGSADIPWHSDDEPELGINPTVFSLSLSAQRVFLMKNRNTTQISVLAYPL